jgi:hypothetical protein
MKASDYLTKEERRFFTARSDLLGGLVSGGAPVVYPSR